MVEVHVIAEFYEARERELLDSPDGIKELLERLSREIGGRKIAIYAYEFQPYGVSGFLLMEDGYVAIHTWPEHSYATVNISFRGETDKWKRGLTALVEALKPRYHRSVEVKPGVML